MWNWISAFGVLVELIGFATLAVELIRTLKSDIFENLEVAQQRGDLSSITASDGPDGAISLDGGQLGKLIEQINARQMGLRDRMKLIVIGTLFSGAGCLLQVVGGFGQALTAPPPPA